MLLSIRMLMLSATQVYSFLTIQLFAFLNLLPIEADILAYNFENASQTFDDCPVRLGYRLPAEGLKICFFFFIFLFNVYLFLREREHVCMSGGGAGR